MVKTLLTTCAVGLALVAGAAPLRADDAGNAKLESMYLELTKYVSQGNKDPKIIVSMALPGVPIPNEGLDRTNDDDMVFLNNVLDHIPLPSGIYSDSNLTYSQVYGRIMKEKQVRQVTPSQAEKDEAAALHELLKGDVVDTDGTVTEKGSPEMAAYRKYEALYTQALDDFANATYDYRVNHGKPVSNTVTSALSKAREDWENDGYRSRIEKAMDRAAQLSNKDGGTYWFDLAKKYDNAMADQSGLVKTYPKAENWGGGNSWTKFSWSSSKKYEKSSYDSMAVEAAASYHSGGVGVDLSGGWSKATADAIANSTDMAITVELRTIYIFRDWLDASVFNNTNWNLSGNFISNGKPLAGLKGDMPMILNKIVLARNLKITGSWISSASHEFNEHIHAEARVSVGPFSVSGSFSKTNRGKEATLDAQKGEISNPGIQVVGYVSTRLPKSPNPKP